jgi:hypothetical protein
MAADFVEKPQLRRFDDPERAIDPAQAVVARLRLRRRDRGRFRVGSAIPGPDAKLEGVGDRRRLRAGREWPGAWRRFRRIADLVRLRIAAGRADAGLIDEPAQRRMPSFDLPLALGDLCEAGVEPLLLDELLARHPVEPRAQRADALLIGPFGRGLAREKALGQNVRLQEAPGRDPGPGRKREAHDADPDQRAPTKRHGARRHVLPAAEAAPERRAGGIRDGAHRVGSDKERRD